MDSFVASEFEAFAGDVLLLGELLALDVSAVVEEVTESVPLVVAVDGVLVCAVVRSESTNRAAKTSVIN